MYPSQHLFYGALFAAFLAMIVPAIGIIGFSIILLSTVLIDIDHYLAYGIKKKDWSLRNAYTWHKEKIKKILAVPKKKRKNYYCGLYILHGVEILFLLLMLSFTIAPLFLFVLTGFSFHLLLDFISDYQLGTNSYKGSILHNLYKSKRMKSFEEL